MTDTRGTQLAGYIRELTEPHTHVEAYNVRHGQESRGRRHITRAPALRAQLWANDVPSAGAEKGPRPGFSSRPAARLDAAVPIDLKASQWFATSVPKTQSPPSNASASSTAWP